MTYVKVSECYNQKDTYLSGLSRTILRTYLVCGKCAIRATISLVTVADKLMGIGL